MKRTKLKTAAVLTIHQAGARSEQGRRDIAKWLTKQARNLRRYGKNYCVTRFTARYQYR